VVICLLCAGIIMTRRGNRTWCAHVEEDGEVLRWERDVQKLVIEDIHRQIRELRRDV
jgi:hypothetical protein